MEATAAVAGLSYDCPFDFISGADRKCKFLYILSVLKHDIKRYIVVVKRRGIRFVYGQNCFIGIWRTCKECN